MRRFSLAVTLLALPTFALTLILAGCGGKDTGPSGSSSSSSDVTQDTKASSGPAKVMESKGGVLKGKIKLASKPNIEQLSDQLKSEISKSPQKDFCMSGSPAEIAEQEYRIGKNGNLGNVFVWVLPPSNAVFKVDDSQLQKAKKPVKIGQPHCAFLPHCAIAWVDYRDAKDPSKKVKTGQYVEVVNDAKDASHNTNYEAGSKNPSGNETLAAGKSIKIEKLSSVNAPMTLKCNIHTWMKGYVWLLDTPYSALSCSDTLDGENKVKEDDDKFGTFEIKNLPTGKVRVLAWHEKCDWLNNNGAKGEEIEIAEGKETLHDFTATPK